MPLVRLRRCSRIVAAILLASLWSLTHRASDDICAAVVPETHDESRHGLGPASAAEPDHCAVCHSVRSPRRLLGPPDPVTAPVGAGAVVVSAAAAPRRAPAFDRLPARAPPAPLT